MKTKQLFERKDIMSFVQLWFDRAQRRIPVGCPEPEDIAGYAFGDLDKDSERNVESHILKCFKCLMEVIDLRSIMESACGNQASLLTHKKHEPKPLARTLRLEKIEKLTRKETAKYIFEQLRALYPKVINIPEPAVFRGAEKDAVIRLPHQIWYAKKKRRQHIVLLNEPRSEESTELKPLVSALQALPFYYFIIGLGKDNKFRKIKAHEGKVEEACLPIEISESALRDIDILLVVIDIDETKMQDIFRSLIHNSRLKKLSLPKIEPFAWVLFHISS